MTTKVIKVIPWRLQSIDYYYACYTFTNFSFRSAIIAPCLPGLSLSLFIFFTYFFVFLYQFQVICFIQWPTNDSFGFTHHNLEPLLLPSWPFINSTTRPSVHLFRGCFNFKCYNYIIYRWFYVVQSFAFFFIFT